MLVTAQSGSCVKGLRDVERSFVLVAIHHHDGQDELVRPG